MISPAMITLLTLLSSSACIMIGVAADVPRPRGVQLSRAALYDPIGEQKDSFLCLDGLKTIKYEQVNDDYCDCADGSDEPGTAACPNGQFYCRNAGHRPLLLPSSRVNDGICDCCDASDEYGTNADCVDDCSERGQEDRVREKERAELVRLGAQLRVDMVAKGKARKAEQATRLAELKESHSEAQRLVDERAAIKRDAEELESDAMEVHNQLREEHRRAAAESEAAGNRADASAAFQLYDANGDGNLTQLELRAHSTFDKNRDGEVSDEEADYFLGGESSVDEAGFVELAWPQVRQHVALDGGYIVPPVLENGETVSQTEPQYDQENDDVKADDEDDHLQRAVDEATTASATQPDDPHRNILPTGDNYGVETDLEEEYEEEEEEEEEETGEGTVEEVATGAGPIEHELELDPDTQQLVDHANSARKLLEDAEREVRQISTEIFNIEQQLEKDYGAGEEYAALHGECVEYTDREYVYKVCPFDRAVQQSRNGGPETS